MSRASLSSISRKSSLEFMRHMLITTTDINFFRINWTFSDQMMCMYTWPVGLVIRIFPTTSRCVSSLLYYSVAATQMKWDLPADSTVSGFGFGFGWRGWIGASEDLRHGRYSSSLQSFNRAPAVVLNRLFGQRSSAHVCSF